VVLCYHAPEIQKRTDETFDEEQHQKAGPELWHEEGMGQVTFEQRCQCRLQEQPENRIQ